MKSKIARVLAIVALLATASANMGCLWIWADEPKALKSMID